ncbi:hypothetical protein ACH5RR_025971 [Cinchona calisaya]|uniref:Uncharacterized protein n=1 Tax=Cinchona calisaya TaxID=153742 RepID=A0ABD2Z162_9GENT
MADIGKQKDKNTGTSKKKKFTPSTSSFMPPSINTMGMPTISMSLGMLPPISQPHHLILPHAGLNTSITFISTSGTQDMHYNYIFQGNTSATGVKFHYPSH